MVENQLDEETLDPKDWDQMRALGHRMIDDIITHYQTLHTKPTFKLVPQNTLEYLREPVPDKPQGSEKAYQDFIEHVLNTDQNGNIHPRWWGFVMGTGTPMGMLADMLASALNQGPEISMQVTYHVELQVLDWIKEMLDYPVESSGILVSGASIANLIGLTVARNSKAQIDMRERGLKENPGKMALYGSTEMHGCIQKNVELLGLGNESLRRIPVNDEFQIDIDALKKAISEDKNAGYQPFCIVGNAGTVNTGAFDDLNTLADICMEEGLWFHIDGAFGAWAVLSPKIHHLVSGMERADSLAVDLHKWISLPKGIGCALIRRKEDHRNSFSLIPDYLKVEDSDAPAALHELGFELSRTFRALKVWMSLKENGVDKYRRLIQQNVDQAQYLAELVDAAPELECLAPVSLNIVCFRYVVDGLDDEALNDINTKLFNRLMFGGKVFVSSTVIGGKFALRACFINHRTRMNDLDVLVHEVVNIGDELVKPG